MTSRDRWMIGAGLWFAAGLRSMIEGNAPAAALSVGIAVLCATFGATSR